MFAGHVVQDDLMATMETVGDDANDNCRGAQQAEWEESLAHAQSHN